MADKTNFSNTMSKNSIAETDQTQQQLLITDLPSNVKPYNVSDDEYFDYEKQYQKIQKRKRKKEIIHYSDIETRMPSISMRLLDEAINMQMLPPENREKLIRNPNKYSIFFCKFNCDSPSMRQAMIQQNIMKQDLDISPFEKFVEKFAPAEEKNEETNTINQDYLKKLIQYLTYITEHYEKLKSLLNLRSSIKRKLRTDLLSTRSNGDFTTIKFNQGIDYTTNKSMVASTTSFNRSLDRSIITLEDRSQRQKLKAQKEQSALEKYIDQFLEKKKCIEVGYQQTQADFSKRIKKQKKDHDLQILKKQELHKKKLEKVFEKSRYIQEQKEEKIMNKFKKMDEIYSKAQERKIQFDLERQEIIQGNSQDGKIAKIREIREFKETKQIEEREILLRTIEDKQFRSTQLVHSQLNMHQRKIELQRNKYHSTMDLIQMKEKEEKQQQLQTLIHGHLDIQQKEQNKKKQLEQFYKTRAKEEKKKNELHEKVRQRLDFLEEQSLEKDQNKRAKHEEKLVALKNSVADWRQKKHDKFENTMRIIQNNLAVVNFQKEDRQNQIIEKNHEIAIKRNREKDSLERYRNSSRSLHIEMAHKKQELLLRM